MASKVESFSRNLHWTENRNSDIINKGNEIETVKTENDLVF